MPNDHQQQGLGDRRAAQRAQHHAELTDQSGLWCVLDLRDRRHIGLQIVHGARGACLRRSLSCQSNAGHGAPRGDAGDEGRIAPGQMAGRGLLAGALIELLRHLTARGGV